MPSIFAISDTWFNRLLEDDPNANVIDNNEHIIENWNNVVNGDDEVYILGGLGIGDLYHILVRLNGKIHIMNNFINRSEKESIKSLKECIEKSSDPNISKKIIFESDQIIVLDKLDTILSYYPFENWSGKSSGTYCFHGLTDTIDMNNHNISCMSSKWNCSPVDLIKVQTNIETFTDAL